MCSPATCSSPRPGRRLFGRLSGRHHCRGQARPPPVAGGCRRQTRRRARPLERAAVCVAQTPGRGVVAAAQTRAGTEEMMRETRIRRLPAALSALVALPLAVLPLPEVVDTFRPDFLMLVVFYWCIESPRAL